MSTLSQCKLSNHGVVQFTIAAVVRGKKPEEVVPTTAVVELTTANGSTAAAVREDIYDLFIPGRP